MSKHPKEPTFLRAEAEAQLSRAPPTEASSAPPEQLLHELRVHQIELEMQNDELRKAQLALEESRDRYVDLYEFAPVGYLTLSRDGKIAEVNLSGSALLGVDRNKMINRSFGGFVLTKDSDRWHLHFLSLLQYDRQQSCELALKRGDGSIFHAKLDCLPAKIGNSIRIAVTDITERKQAEDEIRNLNAVLERRVEERTAQLTAEIALREQKEQALMQYAAIIESSDDAIISITLEGVITTWNGGAERMFGYTPKEVLGCPITFLIPEQFQHEEEVMLDRIRKGISVKHYEAIRRHKDGKVIDISVTLSPLRNAGGNIVGASKVARDISERKKIESALNKERDFIKAILDTAGALIVVLDRKGRIVQLNKAGETLTGYRFEEIREQPFWDIFLLEKERVGVAEAFDRLSAGDIVARYENHWRCKDGNARLFDWYNTVLLDDKGDVEYLVGIANDITERKRAEETLQKNEANLRAILNNSPYLTWLKDAEGHYITINQAFADYLRLNDIRQAVGKTDLDLQPKDLAEKYRADDAEVMASRQQKHVEESAFDGNRIHWVETFKTPIIDEHGNMLGTVGFARDITERKQIEEDLRIAAAAFETHDAIMITDAKTNIIKVNRAFSLVTGYSPEEVLGKNPRIMKSGRHDKAFYSDMFQQLQRDGSWSGEIWDKRKNGEIYPRSMTITAVKDAQHKITQYVSIFSDITDRKKNEELANKLAFYDTLTQLPNRRMLNDRLGLAMAASKRSDIYGAVMFMDLDNFKPLNDTHGHVVGDLLLIEVARRISSCVREMDTVARFGGDEFVVMLSELSLDEATSRDEASIVAEKIRACLAETYLLAYGQENNTKITVEHTCTSSIGVTLFKGQDASQDEILKQADMAMYQAKDAGRNLIRLYGM